MDLSKGGLKCNCKKGKCYVPKLAPESPLFKKGVRKEHILECNPDAEYYTWEEVPKAKWDDAETRKLVASFWCSAKETDTIEGKPYYDSKVFV